MKFCRACLILEHAPPAVDAAYLAGVSEQTLEPDLIKTELCEFHSMILEQFNVALKHEKAKDSPS